MIVGFEVLARHDQLIQPVRAVCTCVLVLFLYRVIRQVPVHVRELLLLQRELARAELEVSTFKDEGIERLPARDEYPLPNIELPLVDEEGPLDVLLHNFGLRFLAFLVHVVELVGAVDADAAGVVRWLDDPYVAVAVYAVVLRKDCLQLVVQYKDPYFEARGDVLQQPMSYVWVACELLVQAEHRFQLFLGELDHAWHVGSGRSWKELVVEIVGAPVSELSAVYVRVLYQ